MLNKQRQDVLWDALDTYVQLSAAVHEIEIDRADRPGPPLWTAHNEDGTEISEAEVDDWLLSACLNLVTIDDGMSITLPPNAH